MLRVRLFGVGQATYGGQALYGFPRHQHYKLFCYLLLSRGHVYPRERLAAVFWAEYPTATSRRYLRTCLWRLRHSLLRLGIPVNDYLTTENDSVALQDSDAYWLDVREFESALRGSKDLPGRILAKEQAKELEKAERLYTGDLLEGIYDDWCLFDRERLRLGHLDLLCHLLAYHEEAGTYELGLRHAQSILTRDPARERVHRQAMRLHWLLGEPHQALAQYHCCVQVLREELDAEPMPKTTDLYEQMLHNQFDPGQPLLSESQEFPGRQAWHGKDLLRRDELLDRLRCLETETQHAGAELHKVRLLIETTLFPQIRD